MTFSIKVHGKNTPNEIVAACDSDIVGMTVSDPEREIEFTISADFYGNEKLEWGEIRDTISKGKNVNIIGNEIVELAVKEEIIAPSSTLEINGIKHAQIYMF
jgi:hypothetical protein